MKRIRGGKRKRQQVVVGVPDRALTPNAGTAAVTGLCDLCVPRTSSMSRDQAVFVDQATGASLFSDAVLAEVDWLG